MGARRNPDYKPCGRRSRVPRPARCGFGSSRPRRGRLPAARARLASPRRGVPMRDHAEEDAGGVNSL